MSVSKICIIISSITKYCEAKNPSKYHFQSPMYPNKQQYAWISITCYLEQSIGNKHTAV